MRTCSHCGLPARLPRRWSEERPLFCCSGCFIAHSLSAGRLDGDSDRLAARLLLSAFLAMGVMVFSLALYGEAYGPGDGGGTGGAAEALRGVLRIGAFALSTPVLVLLGGPLLDAVVTTRRFLSADGLVVSAVLAAWLLSVWSTLTDGGAVYFETATMVLVLVTLGRWLDVKAKERARGRLQRILPAVEPRARRVAPDAGEEREEDVPAEDLRVGDEVRVRPGDLLPVDGDVVRGASFLDESSLTGEEVTRSVRPGARVLAGARVVDGTLVVRATAVRGARIADEVERLLEEARRSTPRLQRLADRAAAWLVPVVFLIALAATVHHARVDSLEAGFFAGLAVILISCPCAFGIATPLAFWIALGEAWRSGTLVRGGEVLERLARTRRVFFDKTGTLTSGELELAGIETRDGATHDEALALARDVERYSEHPLARAVLRAADGLAAPSREVEDFRVLPGAGVEARLDGVRYELVRAPDAPATAEETRVHLRSGERLLAELRFVARPHAEAARSLARLRSLGSRVEVLTGDGRGPAARLARELGVPVAAELLPADKVARIRDAGRRGTVYVGDGLNDLAALACADVGVAVAGSVPANLAEADVHLLRPGVDELPRLVELARRAVSTARWNLVWAFAYNSVGIGLAATGQLSPIFSAAAMVGSSLFVVLNSSRLRGARREDVRTVPYAPAHSDPAPAEGAPLSLT